MDLKTTYNKGWRIRRNIIIGRRIIKMKKVYEKPEVMVIEFATEDIVCTSIADATGNFNKMDITELFELEQNS